MGMYAQIVLGPLQLLIATSITFLYFKKLAKNLQNLILYYWLFAITALIIAFLGWNDYISDDLTIITVFIIPMMVAAYFVYVTYRINKFINPKEE
ncbi:hypothetical protein Q763_00150 [Flavobacterium beibuense F44-8]|uniref:Uncharacterized protein n=2 Tax=Flavobacterium beibuense TaxID=657326 RepID=A0A0A2LV24_9FLAO|nr:hypothetical protein Q763_00150 [Flavobacterium beibuense F44-8]